MKFCTCASFSYGSIYYIYIPCPKNMVERADMLVRLKVLIECQRNGSDYDELYFGIKNLYDDIKEWRV